LDLNPPPLELPDVPYLSEVAREQHHGVRTDFAVLAEVQEGDPILPLLYVEGSSPNALGLANRMAGFRKRNTLSGRGTA
jgi:hypothetical protein